MQTELPIDCDFPGGNIIVEAIDGDVVRLHQDLRDTEGDWFYWAFRVKGAQGRKLTFQFTKSVAVGINGAAFSLDEGKTWAWTGKESIGDNSFKYDFPEDADEVFFCLAIPYLEANLKKFLAENAANEFLKVDTLCQTKKGRDAELLFLGCINSEPEQRVVLTCRHHCCEMMASYVLEGIMQSVLTGSSDDMQWLRDKVEFMVVPFVDKDGVEDGDQGKNRRPHDHNRDYGDVPVHETVKAIKEIIPECSCAKLKIIFDLHCPYIFGGDFNEQVYMVGAASDKIWQQQQVFAEILAKFANDSLPYKPENNLPYGVGWNSGQNYSAGISFTKWIIASLPDIKLTSTFEIPYSNSEGVLVTEESARAFGHDMAKALSVYLQH